MKLIDLFCNFCFHDGDVESIKVNADNIFVVFELTTFLQNKKTKEKYGIDDKLKDCYLKLQVEFRDYKNFQNIRKGKRVHWSDMDLQDCLLWDTLYNEEDDEIRLLFNNDATNELFTISFSCRFVDIIACKIETRN